ncbi:MAG: DEAD/DEAH box helicase, partial [Euzebyales bacterium]|nr:DEAD/DEAH box helicase [Euzebyales bacterium]
MTTTTPATGAAPTKTFADLGVEPELTDALAGGGIIAAFPIQELTLPLALSGADVIGQARTGTGKTLAFGLPLLQRIDTGDLRTQALVIVPTRELCLQVRDDLARAGAVKGVGVVAVYGGRPIDPQADAIAKGAPIVVGTPGRLLDLVGRGMLDLSTATKLVLDEADEMLDLGFLPDVEQLIEATADNRQTMLFSATMPGAVVGLARRYMSKPTFLRADVEEIRIAPETQQYFFACHKLDKPAVLARILTTPERGLCLVFVRTKRMADILAKELKERGTEAAAIHSDLRQEARERALDRFRKGKTSVLVATEVAARGLDIDDVTHVVNYDCPDDEKMYLHRIGRTGRAGGSGVAITLAMWNEAARLEMIKRALDIDAPTHEVFSTSETLDELFDLPAQGVAYRAPKSAGSQHAAERPGRRSSPKQRPPRKPAATIPAQAAAGPREAAPRDTATETRTAETKTAESAASENTGSENTGSENTGSEGRARTRTRTRRRTAPTGRRDAGSRTPDHRGAEQPAGDQAAAEPMSAEESRAQATRGRRRAKATSSTGGDQAPDGAPRGPRGNADGGGRGRSQR